MSTHVVVVVAVAGDPSPCWSRSHFLTACATRSITWRRVEVSSSTVVLPLPFILAVVASERGSEDEMCDPTE